MCGHFKLNIEHFTIMANVWDPGLGCHYTSMQYLSNSGRGVLNDMVYERYAEI